MSTAGALLAIENLSISFGSSTVVRDLDLHVHEGERFALVGESGSGKTATARSILQLLPNAAIAGSIRFQGRELTGLPRREIQAVRGSDIAMIFQEPMTALNPLFSIGNQIIETIVLHEGLTWKQARRKAIQLLERTGITDPSRRIDSYPHQLSGGQRQRAMIAMTMACKPRLLIADEPTTALDVRTRAKIVKTLIDLQAQEIASGSAMAILLITHDLHLVKTFAERVGVMEKGRLVETGTIQDIFQAPKHPYTQRLMRSAPVRQVGSVPVDAPVLLRAAGISVDYPRPATNWREWLIPVRHRAVDAVDLQVREGETIGVVGESGSGKSTLAMALLGLIRPSSGELEFEGRQTRHLGRHGWKAARSKLQAVFQDPFGSLSPRQTVRDIIGEGLTVHFPELTGEQRLSRIIEALDEVGLPVDVMDAYPHEFSGGQRQRIAIARALVVQPRILVLDEPTSALDVSIQSQVLALLAGLQRKRGLSYVLVTHDLSVIRAMAHRVYVMKDGRVLESGDVEAVINHPSHAYTQELVDAAFH